MENLKKLRQDMLLTQQELADKLDVSIMTIVRAERGDKMSLKFQRKLREFLVGQNNRENRP